MVWYFKDFPMRVIVIMDSHSRNYIGQGLPSGDTIGVAPGAYWMACDLVTSTVEELPHLKILLLHMNGP